LIEIDYEHKDEVAEFVASRVPAASRGWVDNFAAIGFRVGGDLIAGTVFHGWTPEWGIVEMSSASDDPRWLTPATLKAIFGYPFTQLNCRKAVMRVSSINERMCSIARRFGFSEHVLPDLRGDGEDDIVFILDRDDLNERFR
jgi:RimJ/RimL family protein N-acetyltransferase